MFGDKLNVFEVGGYVRDSLLWEFGYLEDNKSKDIDFSVEAESFDVMAAELETAGFTIFKSDPQFVTLRAQFPKTSEWSTWLSEQGFGLGTTADFVLCRKDGVYKDGRRPETVTPGDIFDDLARRDFTVNAIARHADVGLIDPHKGVADCSDLVLRFVGDPMQRIKEDGLRVLRGLRFMCTRDLEPDDQTRSWLRSGMARDAVRQQHDERVFEELKKMFTHDTPKAIQILNEFDMLPVVFPKQGNMWLLPTLRER